MSCYVCPQPRECFMPACEDLTPECSIVRLNAKGRNSSLLGQGKNSFKDSTSTTLFLAYTHTHTQTCINTNWRTVHCSQHISSLSLDCLNTTGGMIWESKWEQESEGDKQKGRKRKMIEGRRGREKRHPSMTSKEITHSLELLLSCYHFPRQRSFPIRPEVSMCMCVWMNEWQKCMWEYSVCGGEKARDFWISMRWSKELSSTMICILHTVHCTYYVWQEKCSCSDIMLAVKNCVKSIINKTGKLVCM